MADERRDADLGVEAAVGRPIPHIEVEVLPDVHAFFDGHPALPGSRWLIPGGLAVMLVGEGHVKVVGSEDPEAAEKRWAAKDHDKVLRTKAAPKGKS